jgi:hypothetical protein
MVVLVFLFSTLINPSPFLPCSTSLTLQSWCV